jgi:hypothetical protein
VAFFLRFSGRVRARRVYQRRHDEHHGRALAEHKNGGGVSPDTDIENAAAVYHAIATRCDPTRDIFVVPHTRGSPYDPAATPLEGSYPFRINGKIGIDATVKARHDQADFERAWPRNWEEARLENYL